MTLQPASSTTVFIDHSCALNSRGQLLAISTGSGRRLLRAVQSVIFILGESCSMVRHKSFMRLHRSEPLRQYMSPVIKLSAIQLCVPMSTIDRYLSRCAFRRFLRWNPLTWNMDTKYLSAYGMPNNRLSEDQRVHHRAIPNRNSMVGSMGCSTWMFQISGTNPHTSLPLHVCLESSCCLYFCACIDMPGP